MSTPPRASALFWAAPRLWPVHLLALAAVVVAGALGVWQLQSWQAARAAQAVDLTDVATEPLAEVLGPDDPFTTDIVGQPVTLAGTWLGDSTLYVSGRPPPGESADATDDSRTGYWVVTPVAVDGVGSALMVVRGWVADPADAPAAPDGPTDGDLVGWLQPGEGTGESDPDPGDDVLPQLRIADAVQFVDRDLYGGYVVLDHARTPAPVLAAAAAQDVAAATLDQLPDSDRFTGLRNLLYALEWWVFGGFAVFVWWRYLRDVRESLDAPAERVG